MTTSALSRRSLLRVGASGAALLGLAACAGDPGASAPAGPGFPVSLPGKEGTAEIARQPERVVAVGRSRDGETAIALDTIPVGMTREEAVSTDGIAPWVAPRLAGRPAPALLPGSASQPVEQIAALRPDLILATDDGGLARRYATLSGLAPTVSYVRSARGDSWQEASRRIGTALGKAAQADAAVAQVEASIVQARDANPRFAGRTITFGTVSDQLYTSLPGDSAVALLTSLGFRLSDRVATLPPTGSTLRAAVSPELVSVIDADVIILTYPDPGRRAAFESGPLFQRLAAVQQGRYVALPYDVAVALAFPSLLSIPYGLDRTVAALAPAVAA